MLSHLVASGHNLYIKPLYVYLKQMIRLENMHPDVHRQFTQGMHVIRRNDRFWAGFSPDLSSNLVIDEEPEDNWGLTRGRSMTETQRLVLVSVKTCLCGSQQWDAATDISHI